MNLRKLSYLNHIDSLRAIAVLLVILFHLDIQLFKGGFIGVDIFFVISGFLITRILTHEFFETGKVNLKNFYTRRIRRLMPTLFLTLFLTFIFTFLIFSPSDFMNSTKSMFMSSLAISNFHFLGESSYFDISSNFKPLLHTWSLGIEEQFYLIYPFTLFLLMKIFRKKIIIASFLFVFLVSSLILNIYTSKFGVPENISNWFLPKDNLASGVASIQFYLLPFRMFEFLIGAILVFLPQIRIKSDIPKIVLNIIGFALIIYFSIVLNKETTYLSTLNLMPCIGAGMLLYCPPSKYLSFIFDNRFLKYTGKISYTLYLIHWLLIVIYKYSFGGEINFLEQISLFTIMFLTSSLIYKYYESPLRYTKARFSIKSNTSLSLMLLIGILVIYTLNIKVNYENGWLWRLDKDALELVKTIENPKDFHKNNWGAAGYSAGWLGEKAEKNLEPDMIWLGDSHAMHFKYGLDNILVKKNKKHIFFPFLASTMRLPDVICTARGEKKSKEFTNSDLSLLKKYPKSVVVLSHSWTGQIKLSEVFNETTKKYDKIPQDSTGWRLLANKIKKLQQLTGEERIFIVIGETPSMEGSELNYVEKLLRPKHTSKLSEPVMATFSHNEIEFNDFFRTYFESEKNIRFLDPTKAICHDGTCLVQENDKIYFSDNNHLTKDGSDKVVKYLEEDFLNIIHENYVKLNNY